MTSIFKSEFVDFLRHYVSMSSTITCVSCCLGEMYLTVDISIVQCSAAFVINVCVCHVEANKFAILHHWYLFKNVENVQKLSCRDHNIIQQ